MRIIICDDDMIFRDQLTMYLQEFFTENKLAVPEIVTYSTGNALLQDTVQKDIVFLDIEMPDMKGTAVGTELKKTYPSTIVFVISSYMEYLDDAMRFHVFRYLSKPLDKQRLFHNMKEALQSYHASTTEVIIESKQGVYKIPSSEIAVVEAQTRKVIIHTLSQDYESTKNMAYWVALLQENCFFQTHRSYIVNMKHVTYFDHSLVHLCDNRFQAYLTRRKYTSFKDAYLFFIGITR